MSRYTTRKRVKGWAVITAILIALLVAFGIGIRKTDKEEHKIDYNKVAQKEETQTQKESIASWYDYALGEEDQQCTPEREPCYSQRADTCASREYPRGTKLKISYNKNNIDSFVICRVNDYGPEESFVTEGGARRDIDLSSYAFKKLAPLEWGLINVTIEEVKP